MTWIVWLQIALLMPLLACSLMSGLAALTLAAWRQGVRAIMIGLAAALLVPAIGWLLWQAAVLTTVGGGGFLAVLLGAAAAIAAGIWLAYRYPADEVVAQRERAR